jgi:hypothetical protein
MYSDKLTQSIARVAKQIMDEQLKGDQHKIDKNKNNKIDAHDFKLLRKEKGLDEGRVGQVSADLTDLSHSEFQKEYGKPKSYFDPTNFKKPVQPGKEMDRAKALAQRGMASVKKEDVELQEEHNEVKVHSKEGKHIGTITHGKYQSVAYAHPNSKFGGSKEPRDDEDSKILKGPQDNQKGIDFIKAHHKSMTEEVEQLQEYQAKDGVYKHQGTYGRAKDMEAGETNWDKEDKLAKDYVKPAATKRTYGAHQKRRTNTKLYKEMLESLQSGGIKSLFRTIEEGKIYEEASEEEFNSELADQKAKFDGKKKGGDVAAPATQGVKNVKEAIHTELQIIDMTNGLQRPQVTIVDLEERELTAAETAKKEEIVKSMKKGLSSFKDRYGDRAKEVMYATATKTAKEKA